MLIATFPAYPEELLRRLLDSLNPAFQNVVDFRHPSWWDGPVQRTLARQASPSWDNAPRRR